MAETGLTDAEFAILELVGWRKAGGALLDGVMCPAFYWDGQRMVKRRSAWRAIISEAEASDAMVEIVAAVLYGRVEIARNLYAATIAAEREACARVAETHDIVIGIDEAHRIAAAIRARGE
jgi:hypothetical protein